MRNKTKSQNTFPPPLPSSRAQLHSRILYQPPQQHRGTGMGFMFITRYFLPLHPPQGQDSSHSSPPPAWGPSHGRQSSTNFSNVGPSHGLQFFTNCSSMGPFHGVQSFRSTLLQRESPTGSQVLPENLLRGLLSTDPQVLPGTCSSAGSPRGHSLLREPTCSGVGSSTGCRWRSAPPWTSLDCRGTACLTMVFTMGCRGISALVPGAPPPPPSSLTLVSAGLFLLHVLTPLSGCRFCLSQLFFFLLEYVITEALPLSLIGSALASGRSVSEPAGIGSVGHRGSFQQLLTEATPVTPPPPPLPKPCHTKPIQQGRMPLAFLATWAHCWLIFSWLSTTTPRSFSAGQLSSHSSPSL
ncbi:uncharacterized protein ACIBXB_006064 isoform 2-T2 [Morphnus guianensis]